MFNIRLILFLQRIIGRLGKVALVFKMQSLLKVNCDQISFGITRESFTHKGWLRFCEFLVILKSLRAVSIRILAFNFNRRFLIKIWKRNLIDIYAPGLRYLWFIISQEWVFICSSTVRSKVHLQCLRFVFFDLDWAWLLRCIKNLVLFSISVCRSGHVFLGFFKNSINIWHWEFMGTLFSFIFFTFAFLMIKNFLFET